MLAIFGLCLLTGFLVTQWLTSRWAKEKRLTTAQTLIVLGSGGHTAEMTGLLKHLDSKKYAPRKYIAAGTDALGWQKAKAVEEFFVTAGWVSDQTQGHGLKPEVYLIPRSREVGQSYLTSVWTTLVAMSAAFYLVLLSQPDLVLVNGPGTCIPICVATVLLRPFNRWRGQVIYVESIARVSSLSLSGKILYSSRMADVFFVQWPELQKQCKRAVYAGRLF